MPASPTPRHSGRCCARSWLTPSRPCAGPGGVPDPLVSVVIATSAARPEMLRRCLLALRAQDYPHFEVIVVVNPVDERSADPGRPGIGGEPADPRVRVLRRRRPGASAARNHGLAHAAGEIVAFTDDDTEPGRGWLRAIVARFAAEPDADCVSGLVLPGELETPAQVWFETSGHAFTQRFRRASYAGGPYAVTDRFAEAPARPHPIYAMGPFGTGSNLALRARVARALGGFSEALGPGTPARAGEDLLLLLRLLAGGGRVAFEPAAFVRHWHRRDRADLHRQVRGYGLGFTAMLTAAIFDDRRHLAGLARFVVATALGRRHRETHHPGPPARSLAAAGRLGSLIGPVAYLLGRRRIRP